MAEGEKVKSLGSLKAGLVAVIEDVAEAAVEDSYLEENRDDNDGGGGELGESIFLKSDSESRRWWWWWW